MSNSDILELIAGKGKDERVIALEAVLDAAPDDGVEKAIGNLGSPLTETDRKVLRSLSTDELKSLKSLKGSLVQLVG